MSVDKIIDSELVSENRYHACLDDVPAKDASDMKAFMDYVSRYVLIPKVNEVIDETDLKPNITEVYSKTDTDALLAEKSDSADVYTKTDTDALLAEKADSADVYTKTDTDALLAEKSDSADVYTKTDTDTLLALKADISGVYGKDETYNKAETDNLLDVKPDSSQVYYKAETYSKDEANALLFEKADDAPDRFVTDTASEPDEPAESSCRIYRMNNDLYQQRCKVDGPIPDGALARDCIKPLPCFYHTVADLTLALDDIGLNEINLFRLVPDNEGGYEQIAIVKIGEVYSVTNITGYVSTHNWTLDEWVNGEIDLVSYFVDYDAGFENAIIEQISGFGLDVLRNRAYDYTKLETDVYTKTETDARLNTKADLTEVADAITKTRTGTYVKIPKGDVSRLKQTFNALTITGNSVQDGTPTPEAPVPIRNVGDLVTADEHFGKYAVPLVVRGNNMLDVTLDPNYDTEQGLQPQADGSYYIYWVPDIGPWGHQIPVNAKPNTVYTFTAQMKCVKADSLCVVFYYTDGSYKAPAGVYRKSDTDWFISTVTSDVSKTVESVCFNCGLKGPNVDAYVKELTVTEGSAITAYEPYLEPVTTTLYLDEPLRQGDTLDVVSGKLTRRRGCIQSYDGEQVGDDWISTTGALTTGATVEYELSTPIEIDLTEQDFTPFDDSTVFTLDTETPPASVSATYNQASNAAISELQAAIIALGGSI